MELKEFISELEGLADGIERSWRSASSTIEAFPGICAAALEKFQTSYVVSFEKLLDELPAVTLPRQTFPHRDFSELPLTLVRRDGFCVDVYIWLNSDTSIHDHNFCGAFKLLQGNSIQADYTFESQKQLGPGIFEGTMTLASNLSLATGRVQEIAPNENFIHHVFHMAKMTVTLCVRTDYFNTHALAVYLFPKYKVILSPPSPMMVKWLHVLDMVLAKGDREVVVEFDDCEVLRCLYLSEQGRLRLSPRIMEFFQAHLMKRNYCVDFFDLLQAQRQQSTKLQKLKALGEGTSP